MEGLRMGTTGMVAGVAAAVLLVAIGLRFAGATRQRTGSAGESPTPPASHALPPQLPPEVVRALASGRKIEAIKAYRAATGCDLLTAKQVCDAVEAGMPPPR